MITKTLMAAALAITAGTTPALSAQRPIHQYPEAREYLACVHATAQHYASQQGSPVDLAFAALASCRGDRDAMERAIRRDYSNTFVVEFMARNYYTMIESATDTVARTRAQN